MRLGNCLWWACRQWRRYGGYIAIRKSNWGWFPHFVWISRDGKEWRSFVPDNPRMKKLPPPLFRGHVKDGDEPKE